MPEGVCLECGAEMPYDWAPCPQCGWKALEAWEVEGEPGEKKPAPGFLSSPRPWIGWTVWLLLGLCLIGLGVVIFRH
jgi:hypothetical protein